MDNLNRIEMADISAQNRKKATFAMCKVSVLLLIVTVMSDIVSFSLNLIVAEFADELRYLITWVLSLFGAQKNAAYTSAKLVLGSDAFFKVLSLVKIFVSLVIPCTIFARLEGVADKESFNVKGKIVKGIIPMFCLCHLFTTLASVFSGAISDFMLPEASSVYESVTGVVAHEFNIYEFAISILCTSIFVPLVEEYVFRGVIFSYLRRFGTSFGVVASAAIFALAHLSPVQSVYAFVFGIFSAVMVVVTGNIKTSVLLHAGNNFLTVALGYVLGELDMTDFNVVSGLYVIVISAIGIYGLYRFCRADGIVHELQNRAQEKDSELVVKPGIGQIIVLPLVFYILYYAGSVLITVM